MAASPTLPPWFETARYARLLTTRPCVLSSCQIAKICRFTASKVGIQGDLFARLSLLPLGPRFRGDERRELNRHSSEMAFALMIFDHFSTSAAMNVPR
jgi:hypothetical protein